MAYREPPHAAVYMRWYDLLFHSIPVKEVADSLLSAGHISMRDRERISLIYDREGQIAASESLLIDVLVRNPDPDSFKCVTDAIESAGRKDIAEMMRNYHVHLLGEINDAIGDISILEFSRNQKSKLVSCKIYNIVPIGNSGAGKSSVTRSLILNRSHLTSEEDRTVVAQLLTWNPGEMWDSIFLCHDVTSTNVEGSIQWLKETQTVAPDSQVLLCLTKMDKLDDASREEKIQTCLDTFSHLIKREIQQTKESCQATKDPTNKALYEKRIKCYEALQKQIESHPIFLSCKPGHEYLLDNFREYLLRQADRIPQIMLSEVDKEFFLRIGKLGLKEPMVDPVAEMTESYPSPRPGSSTQDTAHKAQHVQDDSNDVQLESGHESQEHHPQKPSELRQQYVSLDEALDAFSEILQKKGIVEDNPKEEMKKSLENLNNRGLLRYFLGDEDLEKVVFHDISTLTNVLRCVFHHNMEDFLDFDKIAITLRQNRYNNRPMQFKKEVDLLHKHGILSKKLLEVLLLRSNCTVEPVIVMKLLAKLNIAHIFEDAGELQAFVPYFVRTPFDKFESHQKEFLRCDGGILSLHTMLKGEFPLSFFHEFIVKVIRKYRSCYKTQRQNATWCKGLFLTLGRKNAKFMIVYNDKKQIECYVQADISSLEGHRIMWDCIEFFNDEANQTWEWRFPGVIFDYILLCTHCKLLPITEGVQEEIVHEWDIEEDLLSDETEEIQEYHCQYGTSTSIPRALVAPLSKEAGEAEECLEQLWKYLKDMSSGKKSQTNKGEQTHTGPVHAVRQKSPAEQSFNVSTTQSTQHLTELHTPNTLSVADTSTLALNTDPPGQQPGGIPQMLATLSNQVFVQGQAHAQQMKQMEAKLGDRLDQKEEADQQRQLEMKRVVCFATGNADSVDVNITHPVLQKHKDDLLDSMIVSDDLLGNLKSEDILTMSQIANINKNDEQKNKANHILCYLEAADDKKLCKFINALEKCEIPPNNGILAKMLKQSYANLPKENPLDP